MMVLRAMREARPLALSPEYLTKEIVRDEIMLLEDFMHGQRFAPQFRGEPNEDYMAAIAVLQLNIHQFSREWFDGLKRGVMQRFCVCSDVGSRHGTSERDRGLDGRHQSGAGKAAAKAAQDAAGQAGGSSGDHAACAQRQSGRISRRASAHPTAGIWAINGFPGFWPTIWCAAIRLWNRSPARSWPG